MTTDLTKDYAEWSTATQADVDRPGRLTTSDGVSGGGDLNVFQCVDSQGSACCTDQALGVGRVRGHAAVNSCGSLGHGGSPDTQLPAQAAEVVCRPVGGVTQGGTVFTRGGSESTEDEGPVRSPASAVWEHALTACLDSDVDSDIAGDGVRSDIYSNCLNSNNNNKGVRTLRRAMEACRDSDLVVRELDSGSLCVSMTDISDEKTVDFVVGVDCITGVCDCVYKLSDVRCQLKPCRFFSEIYCSGEGDPDACYILRGIVFGFRVIDADFKGTYDSCRSKKRKDGEAEVIEEKLKAELQAGMVSRVVEPPSCIHGIFVVPKDDGGGRSVVDCSRPIGESVNGATKTIASHFCYRGVDDVVDNLRATDFLASIDIKDAYRAVQIHPGDRDRQGLKWQFEGEGFVTYMVDNRLCMGLSSSPFIFSRISDFVVRCGRREGVDNVTNYLDDFCIVGPSRETTGELQCRLIRILRRLGFYISFKKLVSPTSKIRFLGIYIDAPRLELSLPEDKLKKLRVILGEFVGKRKVTKKELERLGGLLAHCAKVVRGGRTFSRRIYDLMGPIRKPYYRVRLNKGIMEDILWWRDFVGRFNGKAAILGSFIPTRAVYSDASSWGLAATYGNDWLVGSFKGSDSKKLEVYVGHHIAATSISQGEHINLKEMGAVFEGAVRWAPGWRDSSIIFVTDSAVVCAALNTGRSRSRKVMNYVRKLFWLAVDNNFIFVSTYINTKVNTVCDALSRLGAPGSNSRIRGVDVHRLMCCASIFEQPALCLSRTGPAEEGAEVV